MTMPHDDLYLYMHRIIEEEFPKALRQAFKTLWDNKYARGYGPFDSACHRVRRFHALNSNTFRWLFPNQVSSSFQLPSNPISFEDLDLVELQNIVLEDVFPGQSAYLPLNSPWDFFFKEPGDTRRRRKIVCSCYWSTEGYKRRTCFWQGNHEPSIIKATFSTGKRGI